jgi:release factor glutamine methyltransferase
VDSPWTVRRILSWTAQDFASRGLPSPRLDAEVLLAHALGADRVRLYLDLDRELGEDELAAMRALVARRRAREPVAYLVGRREFYGRPFSVSPAVLVPRPETETLVERALTLLPPGRPARVLDLCTGSGAIGLTLLAERPELRADLSDVSAAALGVARANALALGVADRARLFEGDLFEALPVPCPAADRYDLVVANPPYVAERDAPSLDPDVVSFEPRVALFAGEDGLAIIARLVRGAPAWLVPGGTLLVEIGASQGEAARALARSSGGWSHVAVLQDLGRRDRVLEARAPGGEAEAPSPSPARDGLSPAPPERVVVPDVVALDVDAIVGERVLVPEDDGA